MPNVEQARQGDIFFEVVETMPDSVKPKSDAILAHGEVTGHAHRVSNNLDNVDMFVDVDGQIYMKSKSNESIVITHEEHGAITLDPNTLYCVSRQREYDPVEQERIVAD